MAQPRVTIQRRRADQVIIHSWLLLDIRWYLKELGVPTGIVNLTTTKKDANKDLQPCIDRLAKLLEDFSGGKVNCKVQQDFLINSFRGTPLLTTKAFDLQKLKTERHAEAVLKLETDQAAALAVKDKEKIT